MSFAVVWSRSVPGVVDSASYEFVPTRARAFDAATARLCSYDSPARYRHDPPPRFPGDDAGSVSNFSLFEWLDHDTVALAQAGDNNNMGDIISCRLSDGACHLLAKAPPSDGPPDQPRLAAGQGVP